VVLYVDLPGVTSAAEVQLSVQGLDVRVHVPGLWHLGINLPEGPLRGHQVDGQRLTPVELEAGKVVFRSKSSQLRVQLRAVMRAGEPGGSDDDPVAELL
jgi:hypothetical protein